ncbi:MAG: tRNA (N(6)-L-threonylcarbamoyladenosine(37)-C(2))-methylthiotransferase MtaB [Oligoflexales bacterium]|nr:tRNA (N(6)-L-threonylcarbamoyladenosine(37)-C(2))-methylthiotransferase MtaB [Oligoflexales bacterium]
MKSVYVKTLGCKVNTFDSHALENQFKKSGYKLVNQADQADITVINTCSVTSVAEKEARYLLRRFKRENPDSFRVVTGCYAQIDSATIEQMGEVDFIVPNEAKERLVPLVEERLDDKDQTRKFPQDLKQVKNNRQNHFKSSLTLFDSPKTERTRAFLKIQDGCNGFCSYCQIPYARGASRSVPAKDVLAEAKNLVNSGGGELVLTGIHIGDYGEDVGPEGKGQALFLKVLDELFSIKGLKRLRISSLEPAELSQGLIEVLAKHADKFCDHFHLPLQSGDNCILRLMNRQYDQDRYFESVRMIREYFPKAQVSADVIPGFPGEGEQAFLETIAFIKKCQLASLHVFPYSKRPNTAAIRMPDHLDVEVIKKRAKELRDLSKQLSKEFAGSFVGQSAEVLWEQFDASSGRWQGKTKNYLPVMSETAFAGAVGQVDEVRLRGFVTEGALLATK